MTCLGARTEAGKFGRQGFGAPEGSLVLNCWIERIEAMWNPLGLSRPILPEMITMRPIHISRGTLPCIELTRHEPHLPQTIR